MSLIVYVLMYGHGNRLKYRSSSESDFSHIRLSPAYIFYPNVDLNVIDNYTDRSKAVLLLWFLTVTCSCCPYLYIS